MSKTTSCKSNSCGFCGEKNGVRILPVRLSLNQYQADQFNIPPKEFKIKKLENSCFKYTTRLLRRGYLYIYSEKLKQWFSYYVTKDSYYYPMKNKTESVVVNEDVTPCIENTTFNEDASTIFLPNSKNGSGKFWFFWSEIQWDEDVFSVHENLIKRKVELKHGQILDLDKWLKTKVHSKALSLKKALEQNYVAEFVLYRKEERFNNPTMAFNGNVYLDRYEFDYYLTASIERWTPFKFSKNSNIYTRMALINASKEDDVVFLVPDVTANAIESMYLLNYNKDNFLGDHQVESDALEKLNTLKKALSVNDYSYMEFHKCAEKRYYEIHSNTKHLMGKYNYERQKRLETIHQNEVQLNRYLRTREIVNKYDLTEWGKKYSDYVDNIKIEKDTKILEKIKENFSEKYIIILVDYYLDCMSSKSIIDFFKYCFSEKNEINSIRYTCLVQNLLQYTQTYPSINEWISEKIYDSSHSFDENYMLRAIFFNNKNMYDLVFKKLCSKKISTLNRADWVETREYLVSSFGNLSLFYSLIFELHLKNIFHVIVDHNSKNSEEDNLTPIFAFTVVMSGYGLQHICLKGKRKEFIIANTNELFSDITEKFSTTDKIDEKNWIEVGTHIIMKYYGDSNPDYYEMRELILEHDFKKQGEENEKSEENKQNQENILEEPIEVKYLVPISLDESIDNNFESIFLDNVSYQDILKIKERINHPAIKKIAEINSFAEMDERAILAGVFDAIDPLSDVFEKVLDNKPEQAIMASKVVGALGVFLIRAYDLYDKNKLNSIMPPNKFSSKILKEYVDIAVSVGLLFAAAFSLAEKILDIWDAKLAAKNNLWWKEKPHSRMAILSPFRRQINHINDLKQYYKSGGKLFSTVGAVNIVYDIYAIYEYISTKDYEYAYMKSISTSLNTYSFLASVGMIRGVFYINIAAIILSILIDIAIADSKNQIKKWLRSCYYSKSNSRTLSEFKLYYKRGSRDVVFENIFK